MNGEILSVRTKEKNESLVVLEIFSEGEKIKYTVNEGTYREIGCPLSGECIDSEALAALTEDDGRRRALAKAASLLSFADNSEKNLKMKLTRAGFSAEHAEFATEECVRLGYIDEARQIEHVITKCHEKLIGPHKIIAKLISRGYSAKRAFRIMRELEERGAIDFDAAKKKLIKEKLAADASREDKQKLLHRYGYLK